MLFRKGRHQELQGTLPTEFEYCDNAPFGLIFHLQCYMFIRLGIYEHVHPDTVVLFDDNAPHNGSQFVIRRLYGMGWLTFLQRVEACQATVGISHADVIDLLLKDMLRFTWRHARARSFTTQVFGKSFNLEDWLHLDCHAAKVFREYL